MRKKTLAEREKEWRRLYPEAFQRKPNRSKRRTRKSRHHLRNKVNGGVDVSANMLIACVKKVLADEGLPTRQATRFDQR